MSQDNITFIRSFDFQALPKMSQEELSIFLDETREKIRIEVNVNKIHDVADLDKAKNIFYKIGMIRKLERYKEQGDLITVEEVKQIALAPFQVINIPTGMNNFKEIFSNFIEEVAVHTELQEKIALVSETGTIEAGSGNKKIQVTVFKGKSPELA